MKKYLLLLLASFHALTSISQNEKPLHAAFTSDRIAVDGNSNEPVWQQADSVSTFYKIYNADNTPAESRTVVRILHNDDFIYVSATMYAKPGAPFKYTVSSLKRDFPDFENDLFGFIVNPSADKLNGYSFYLNPYGVQNESQISNGDNFDITWDQKWYSATVRHADYWTAEMAIPFSSIRFPVSAAPWLINFIRIDNNINEYASWTPTPRSRYVGDAAFTQPFYIEKYPSGSKRRINLIPSLTTNYVRQYTNDAKKTLKVVPSLDAKIRLSSSMVADLTLNPDFSQAEVDIEQANITRFELVYPEKRQFFVENSELFAGFGYSGMGGSPVLPFYSRRIGIEYNAAKDRYEQQPVLGGLRIYGKINPKLQIGLMSVQTKKIKINTADPAQSSISGRNFTTLAFQQNVFKRSSIGAIFVNNQSFDEKANRKNAFNRAYSIDFNLGSTNGNWNGKLFHSGTLTGANNKSLEYNLTHMSHGGNLSYNNRRFLLAFGTVYTGEHYNSEAGFTPRTGYISNFLSFNNYFYPKNTSGRLNRYTADLYYERFNTVKWSMTDDFLNFSSDISFRNTSELSVYFNKYFTKLSFDFDPGLSGGKQLASGSEHVYYNSRITYQSDRRKTFFMRVSSVGGQYYNGHRYGLSGDVNYKMQPYGIMSVLYNYNIIKLPSPYSSNHVWTLTARNDISFNRYLFLATSVQYNSISRNLGVYGKLQWRFLPLSDLFFVYQDNYLSENGMHIQDKGITVKANYYF
ncbi:carbohydrate binding family 9 domain-containing protein [Dyadobacter flavalbus]|uniref:Carbohydrate binding family 9 domain-containing protein n=1 Tax=Dyadobacter flavalbus TaxID=2579942 RepID=A0A5M8QPV9_9BACT|nr:carbohydrate binding family 9 domain-containing protein [Dyadobacter flavalbus]KAA6436696.1 carbohydrate binding family 9 domain-containing protein [Dyadobacter flavalbus]